MPLDEQQAARLREQAPRSFKVATGERTFSGAGRSKGELRLQGVVAGIQSGRSRSRLQLSTFAQPHGAHLGERQQQRSGAHQPPCAHEQPRAARRRLPLRGSSALQAPHCGADHHGHQEQRLGSEQDGVEAALHAGRVIDPGGVFEIGPLPPGAYSLTAVVPSGGRASEVVHLGSGQRKTAVRLAVAPAIRVTGRVLEHGSGRPLPGSTVNVTDPEDKAVQTLLAGPAGEFAAQLPSGSRLVRLSVATDSTEHVAESRQISIAPGQGSVDAGTIRLLPGNLRARLSNGGGAMGRLGATLLPEAGGARVTAVEPAGPAGRAGIRAGDALVTVGGTSTAELGLGALTYLTLGKPGSPVDLVVDSGGVRRAVRVTLESTAQASAQVIGN